MVLSRKIKDIKIGDRVWGLNEGNGLQTSICTNKQYMGEKETLEITMITGEKLICTKDHNIMTNNGWIEAKDLTNNDFIMSSSSSPEDIINEDENGWSLNMSYITSKGENKFHLNMSNEYERQKSLAFARILGFNYF